MPSRKKAKGQARKAAKVRNEVAEKAREIEERFLIAEQEQIQRLQVNNAPRSPASCMHGFDPFPDDHVCIKFIRAFVQEFYIWFRKVYTVGWQPERIGIELMEARESTRDEYSEVWNSSAKLKQVIQYFLYNGAMLISAGTDGHARHSAMFARFFEQWLKIEVQQSQACIDWPKVTESARCDKHTFVKYLWRRIPCSCLDEAYEEVKSITKMGLCFSQHCAHPGRIVERSKLRCCSRCRSITYCSRECQVADWSSHKEQCDEVAATRAEFDASASQKQQS